uniref:Uncharacterized protein n=1 Tax=Parascaris equorum TaxID=6256 RepID=A0A914RKI8_PAREQ
MRKAGEPQKNNTTRWLSFAPPQSPRCDENSGSEICKVLRAMRSAQHSLSKMSPLNDFNFVLSRTPNKIPEPYAYVDGQCVSARIQMHSN